MEKTMDIDEMVDNSDDDSFGSSDFEDEKDISKENTECLFCPTIFDSVAKAIAHSQTDHDFNIYTIRDTFSLDSYGYIKLINYIRTVKPDAKAIKECTEPCWNEEKYLTPFNINDPFLWYDLPDDNDSDSVSETKYVNSEGGKIILAQSHFNELQANLHNLTEKLKEKDDQIQALRMLLTDTDAPGASKPSSTEDESYFSSYSLSSIHNEMLQDQPRMLAFQNVFENNKEFFKDKSVLDVGCGTGILAMFAARGGAKDIVGIDESDILYHAFDILRENNLHSMVTLIKGKLENQELPRKKFDVVISEWMGYFLLFEGMLDSVIYARDTYLAEGGLMLPSKAFIHLTGISDLERYNNMVTFWNDVSGFKMSCMKPLSVQEPFVEQVKKEHIITDVLEVYSLDISTCKSGDMEFVRDFVLEIKQDSTLTALAGSFDVDFHLPNPVRLSTSPLAPKTHWQQTLFYLKDPIPVVAGEKLECKISCKRRTVNSRSFDIVISIKGKSQSYMLF